MAGQESSGEAIIGDGNAFASLRAAPDDPVLISLDKITLYAQDLALQLYSSQQLASIIQRRPGGFLSSSGAHADSGNLLLSTANAALDSKVRQCISSPWLQNVRPDYAAVSDEHTLLVTKIDICPCLAQHACALCIPYCCREVQPAAVRTKM